MSGKLFSLCWDMLCDVFQVLPLNVLIPKSKVTDKNRKWYNALKKVWHHKDPWQSFQLSELPEKSAIRHRYVNEVLLHQSI